MGAVMQAAVIGCGAIAQRKHLPLIKNNPFFHLKALYDAEEKNAWQCKEIYGDSETAVVRCVDDIFESINIDVVFIATPNSTHAEYSIRALNKKKHVICEKPMAVNSQEAKAMLEASRRNQRLLHISYQNRYTPQALYAKRLCETGIISEIYYAKAYAIRKRGIPTWGASGNKLYQGGGTLMDIGSHSIDLALWLSNNFEPLYAVGTTYNEFMKKGSEANLWGTWEPKKMEVEDSAFGFVVMKNGMTLLVESAYAMNTISEKEASVDLFSFNAGLCLRQSEDIVLIHELEGKICQTTNQFKKTERHLTPKVSGMSASEAEHMAITNRLLKGEIDAHSAFESFIVTKIVEGIYESAKRGCPTYF